MIGCTDPVLGVPVKCMANTFMEQMEQFVQLQKHDDGYLHKLMVEPKIKVAEGYKLEVQLKGVLRFCWCWEMFPALGEQDCSEISPKSSLCSEGSNK